MPAKYKTIILGGYLGAGKTTLLNNILRQNATLATPRKIAILVNEFGALAIDHQLILKKNEKIIAIAGGCICCSYGNDLIAALLQLAKMKSGPDYIIIETSGVALPNRIASTINLLDNFFVENIIVLIDGLQIKQQLANRYIVDTLLQQFTCADILAINKCDAISPLQQKKLFTLVAKKNTKAEIIACAHANIDPSLIFAANKVAKNITTKKIKKNNFTAFDFSRLPKLNVGKLATLLAANKNIARAKGFLRNHKNEIINIQIAGSQKTLVKFHKKIATALVVIASNKKINKDDIYKLILNTKISAKT